jgi:DNA end-binding protein Ku
MNDDGAKVGIAKVAFRDKEHLAALRFVEDVMVLETMYWPDEIRAAEFDGLEGEGKVRPQEVQMAQALISSLTEPWDPSAFKDEYREALLDIVERKAAGEEIEVVATPDAAPVVDLMAALRASVEAVKGGKEPAEAVADAAPAKAPRAKRASASKSTAKSAASKKATTTERKRKAG